MTGLIMAKKMPFAFETVFSFWRRRADGSHDSKADIISQLQRSGYFVDGLEHAPIRATHA